MTFATRADLLARSSARRLIQLAVPTDVKMVVADEALRTAIAGGDLSALTPTDVVSLNLALAEIDQALADATQLMVSYGLPETAANPLLARLCASIALYYLQGMARMTADVQAVFDAAVGTLKAHVRGELNLLPTLANAALPADQVLVASAPRRYGAPAGVTTDWNL